MAAKAEVLACYRTLQRKLRLLPRESRSYYAAYLRQQFNSHRVVEELDETATKARIRELLQRAQQSASWILQKYETRK